MTKSALAVAGPAIANGTVASAGDPTVASETNIVPLVPRPVPARNRPPRRRRNVEVRAREYLTAAEIDRLMTTARKANRHGDRDATMILLAYRHGLRVAELVRLEWDAVDLPRGELHVKRLKGSRSGVHPLLGDELRALRKLKRAQTQSPFVFTSERGAPFTTSGFRKLVARLGKQAQFGFLVHPHMLRHATGYALANKGRDTRTLQQYLGHANIQHTVRYTELSPRAFKHIWDD